MVGSVWKVYAWFWYIWISRICSEMRRHFKNDTKTFFGLFGPASYDKCKSWTILKELTVGDSLVPGELTNVLLPHWRNKIFDRYCPKNGMQGGFMLRILFCSAIHRWSHRFSSCSKRFVRSLLNLWKRNSMEPNYSITCLQDSSLCTAALCKAARNATNPVKLWSCSNTVITWN